MTADPLPNTPVSDRSSAGELPLPRAEQTAAQPAPPAPEPESPYRHLRRSTTNKVLGGVCGGLAEYTDSDPLLWRVGFIALAVMGAGILIYPLMWLLVPSAEQTPTGLHVAMRKGRSPRS